MVVKQWGNFIEPENNNTCLLMQFLAAPLQARWQKRGLSADFLADYCDTFAPSLRAEAKTAVAYIANELLENAMKFHQPTHPITLRLILAEGSLRFYLTHQVDPVTVPPFQAFIQKLLSENLTELYAQQVAMKGGRLGFLTMLNDYGAELAWIFDTQAKQICVTTMVKLVGV